MNRHLLTVWNPSYSDSAMDAHLRVLLDWAELRASGKAEPEDVYVWWARLKSPHRDEPLSHAAEIAALQEQVDRGEETHLYLTDYRSLYVGHLDEITSDDLLAETPDEADHMPAYYRGERADFWFRLLDLRLLVADDAIATIEELKKLRNPRFHDQPVSLYGGMVELPLIVTREEEPGWFTRRELLTEGRLWAERDTELRGETERMGRELRDNLLGREVWAALEPSTRTFLSAAEAVFRARRDDPRFDFTGPAVSYAKAVELELNALLFPALRRHLARLPPLEREVRVEGRLLDLGEAVPHLTLGTVKTLLEHNELVRKHVRGAFPAHVATLLGSRIPYVLAGLVELRNLAAHSEPVRWETVVSAREEVLGIGQEGLIVQIARGK
jgi:hypothetical protein